MSRPIDPAPEQQSTYFVQDRSNEEELERVHIQDQMLTAGMGGVLVEQPDATVFQSVLDVGCGTGGWLIEAARTYPSMTRLAGADASAKMVTYARAQAEAQHVANRVTFHVMDALRMLEFPAGSFDLVNQRFNMSYLRKWDWPKLLSEYQRVARTGGVIRITEADLGESNSQALTQLRDLLLAAFYQAGHFFKPEKDGVINELPALLRQYGVQQVQTRTHTLIYRAGTIEGENYYRDTMHTFRVLKPFLQKWIRVPDDYEEIYEQALSDIQHADFEARWTLVTTWGTNPQRQKDATLRAL